MKHVDVERSKRLTIESIERAANLGTSVSFFLLIEGRVHFAVASPDRDVPKVWIRAWAMPRLRIEDVDLDYRIRVSNEIVTYKTRRGKKIECTRLHKNTPPYSREVELNMPRIDDPVRWRGRWERYRGSRWVPFS